MYMSFLFDSRLEAGKELSKHLDKRINVDTVVIPYPEACEIGLEIAHSQDADIMVRLSGFLPAPDFPRNIGAVAEDGSIYLDDELVENLDVETSYIEGSADLLSDALSASSISSEKDCEGVAVIVSDGTGDGFREAAVAGSLLKDGFRDVCVATPVKVSNFRVDLENVVDKMFYLEEVVFSNFSVPLPGVKVQGHKKIMKNESAVD